MKPTARYDGATTVSSSHRCNCGSGSERVFKAHVRDGLAAVVEPNDRYNPGVGKEDEVVSEPEVINNRLQRRPCTKGLAFHKYVYHPNRILYPLKRAPSTKRGKRKYVRVSWDRELDSARTKGKSAYLSNVHK